MLLWLAVEAPAEKYMKGLYQPELDFIRTTAQAAVVSLIEQKAPAPDDSQELDIEDAEEEFDPDIWWASIS